MAYSNDQIFGAIDNQRAAGFSDDDIRTGAERLGIDLSVVNNYLGGGGNTSPTPAPAAPAPAPASTFTSTAPTGLLGTASAPAPAPAQSFSDQQVYDAYQTSLGQGISDADIRSTGLSRFGIQESQLDRALQQYKPQQIAPKPAEPVVPPGGGLIGTATNAPGSVVGQLPGQGGTLGLSPNGTYYTPEVIRQLAASQGARGNLQASDTAAIRDLFFRNYGITPTQFDAAMGTTGGVYNINASTYGGTAANGYATMNGQQAATEVARLMRGGMTLDQAKQEFLANGGTTAQLYQGATYLGQPNTAGAGQDLFSRFGAEAYDPTTASRNTQLIDPRTGGANFSSANFDANGNRIATDGGVSFANIKQVVTSILNDATLDQEQKNAVLGGYIKSRGITNSDLANATGLSQSAVDQFVKANQLDMASGWYATQKANFALDATPVTNPVPVFDRPVDLGPAGEAKLNGNTIGGFANGSVNYFQISPLLIAAVDPKTKELRGINVVDPRTGNTYNQSGTDPLKALYVLEQLGYTPDPAIFAGVQGKLEQLGVANIGDPRLVGPGYTPGTGGFPGFQSGTGLNFDMIAKGYLAGVGADDPTSGSSTQIRGGAVSPQQLGQLQQTQILANRYGFKGANTSLVGLDIPYFVDVDPTTGQRVDLSQYGINEFSAMTPVSETTLQRGAILPGSLQTQTTLGNPAASSQVAPGGNRFSGVGTPNTSLSPLTPGAFSATSAAPTVDSAVRSAIAPLTTARTALPAAAPGFQPVPVPQINTNLGGLIGSASPNVMPGGIGVSSGAPGGGSTIGSSTNGTTVGSFVNTASGPATYQAAESQIDPSQTVRGMLDSLLAADSPFIQAARNRALQSANERGLLNSSIATGAAEAAGIDAALQIATPDANNYFQNLLSNTAARNNASQFNTGQINAYDLAVRELNQNASQFSQNLQLQFIELQQRAQEFQANLEQNGGQFNANLALQYQQLQQSAQQFTANQQLEQARLSQNNTQFNRNLQSQFDIAKLNNSFQQAATQAEQQYRTLIQSDESFNQRYAAYIDALFRIDADTSLDAAAKEQRKNEQNSLLRTFAQIKGLNLDLNFLPTFGGSTTTNTTSGGLLSTAQSDFGGGGGGD